MLRICLILRFLINKKGEKFISKLKIRSKIFVDMKNEMFLMIIII